MRQDYFFNSRTFQYLSEDEMIEYAKMQNFPNQLNNQLEELTKLIKHTIPTTSKKK